MPRPLILFLLLPALGCHGSLRDGVFTKDGVRYRVGEVNPGWRQVSFPENDLAFVSTTSPHSLAINATCENFEDAPLDVLTQHLLMGFTDRKVLAQRPESLDGREALESRVEARMDGVPVELVLVVMKKDGCIYDFTYLSPPGRVAERKPDFDQLVKNFKTEPLK